MVEIITSVIKMSVSVSKKLRGCRQRKKNNHKRRMLECGI